jgi:hypothetical protein
MDNDNLDPPFNHDQVVEAFNRLGYQASFAAVAQDLGCECQDLYALYPDCEALAEAWLTSKVPAPPDRGELAHMFSSFCAWLLDTLESQRDFSRAWLAALTRNGPLHLPQLRDLHGAAHSYFCTWFDANHRLISLPDAVPMRDVNHELADVLCLAVGGVLNLWASDRSRHFCHTMTVVESTAYLLDGLLTARPEFGGAGLLVHLHRLLGSAHEQFTKPLLEMALAGDRAQRLADPAKLLEMLTTLRPPSAGHR